MKPSVHPPPPYLQILADWGQVWLIQQSSARVGREENRAETKEQLSGQTVYIYIAAPPINIKLGFTTRLSPPWRGEKRLGWHCVLSGAQWWSVVGAAAIISRPGLPGWLPGLHINIEDPPRPPQPSLADIKIIMANFRARLDWPALLKVSSYFLILLWTERLDWVSQLSWEVILLSPG